MFSVRTVDSRSYGGVRLKYSEVTRPGARLTGSPFGFIQTALSIAYVLLAKTKPAVASSRRHRTHHHARDPLLTVFSSLTPLEDLCVLALRSKSHTSSGTPGAQGRGKTVFPAKTLVACIASCTDIDPPIHFRGSHSVCSQRVEVIWLRNTNVLLLG
jgi:hypothetical protein